MTVLSHQRLGLRSIVLMTAGLLGSCGDVSRTNTASLSVNPESIIFSKVAPGEDELTVPLVISNTGGGRLLISSITLEENDEEKELSLVDADDLRNLTELFTGEEKVVQVKWRVLDALPDKGSITIEHNAGPAVIIPVETPDLDPAIALTSDPEGEQPDVDRPDLEVTLVKARLGEIDSAVISIRSAARAPLVIDEICLQKPSGGCQDDPTVRFDAQGRFKLCGGITRDINDCPVAAITDPIQFDDIKKFTVFFRPNGPDDKGNSAKITIRSNATEHPVTTVKVTGNVCDPEDCPIPEPAYALSSEPAGSIDDADNLAVNLQQAVVGGVDHAMVTITSVARDPLSLDRICMSFDGDDCGVDERQQLDASGRFKLCDSESALFDGCIPPQHPNMLEYGESAQFKVFFRPISAADDGATATIHILSNANGRPMGRVTVTGTLCRGDNCGAESPTCGNGTVDGDEQCDDGNAADGDGCSVNCEIEMEPAVCGNGVQEEGEDCDDGNTVTETCTFGLMTCIICDETCQNVMGETSYCGDGRVDAENGETCDDQNDNEEDGCRSNCRDASCGNNQVDPGEQCDDGNVVDEACVYGMMNCLICNAQCQQINASTYCGDQRTDPVNGETCDDGNTVTEQCAYGELACVVCGEACTLIEGETRYCGDGNVDAVDNETCDDNNAVTETCEYGERACNVCNADCRLVGGETSFCGDGIVDDGNGEQCDERGAANGCTENCQLEMMNDNCGNGIVDAGETCDDPNDSYCDSATCQCYQPDPGPGQYGALCSRGRDCASGLCVPGSRNDPTGRPVASAGYCTERCPANGICNGIDRCTAVQAAPEGCPTPSTPFVVNGQLNVCLKNETGLPCQQPEDCLPGATCITPPNPPGRPTINVQSMCASTCQDSRECPVGFSCDAIQSNNGLINVCQPTTAITQCPSGPAGPPACAQSNLCAGDPTGVYALCIEYAAGRPGVCSCACNSAADCPAGFACSNLGSPVLDRTGTCLPMAGYTCPTGGFDQCLSETCYASDGTDLALCTAPCTNRFDCPTGFSCRALGMGTSVCLP